MHQRHPAGGPRSPRCDRLRNPPRRSVRLAPEYAASELNRRNRPERRPIPGDSLRPINRIARQQSLFENRIRPKQDHALYSPTMDGILYQGTALPLTLLAGAFTPLLLMRIIPRQFAWAFFAIMLNLAAAAFAIRYLSPRMNTFGLIGYFSAGMAVIWSVTIVMLRLTVPASLDPSRDEPHTACLLSVSKLSAITAVAVAALLVMFMVVTRSIATLLEIWLGEPLTPAISTPVGIEGIGILLLLLAACLLTLYGTRDQRLAVPLFWLFVLTGVWVSLMEPAFRPAHGGTFARTAWATICTLCLSSAISGFVCVRAIHHGRDRWNAARSSPEALLTPKVHWPGFETSVIAVGVAIVLLICYQWSVPPPPELVSGRVVAIILAACGLASGSACFVMLSTRFSRGLADVAMGLTTLSIASAFLLFVPAEPVELGHRYPMIFNALMVGLTLMAGFWSWVGQVWRQQLDDDRPWTVAGHLATMAPRFSFFVACLALIPASLMSMWPRLRPISEADASLGRFTAAVAAHLFLILILIRNRRRTERSSFGALAILVTISMIAFIVLRVLPMTSSVIHGAQG